MRVRAVAAGFARRTRRKLAGKSVDAYCHGPWVLGGHWCSPIARCDAGGHPVEQLMRKHAVSASLGELATKRARSPNCHGPRRRIGIHALLYRWAPRPYLPFLFFSPFFSFFSISPLFPCLSTGVTRSAALCHHGQLTPRPRDH